MKNQTPRKAKLKEGYMLISNGLFEALALSKIPQDMRVLFALFRKIYGWHKKEDKIAISQLKAMTRLSDAEVCRALNHLVEAGVIIKTKNGITKYEINNDYGTWKILSDLSSLGSANLPLSDLSILPSLGSVNHPLSDLRDTKYILTKYIKNIYTPKKNDQKNSRNFHKKLLDNDQVNSSFEEFYAAYPRKEAKQAGLRCFTKLLKSKVDPQDLIAAAKNYAAHCKATEARFILLPSTFLGRDSRYQDFINGIPQDQAKPAQITPVYWSQP